MKREYEAAIGRLITNQTALALFLKDELAFLRDYDLNDIERGNIVSMKAELSGLNSSFTGKRKRMVERPIAKTLALMGDYGETLIRRYLNFYPPYGNYTQEHYVLIDFLEEALNVHDGPENTLLVQNVLMLESCLFKAMRSVVPGEEIEHVNDFEPVWEVEVEPTTKLTVRNGVFFGLYDYNLAGLINMEVTQLRELELQETGLIVLRRFGEMSNTLMRVSPTVIQALELFSSGKELNKIAVVLANKSGSSDQSTLSNLLKLATQLCSQQVLVPVENSNE